MESKTNRRFLFLFTIVTITLIGSANAFLDLNIGRSNPDVQRLCDQAEYKDLCVSSIAPLFNGRTDQNSLLINMITATEKATKRALDIAMQMKAKGDPNNGFVQDRLKSCKGKYNDALEELQGATEAMNAKDFSTAQTKLSASITYFGDCSDGFEGEIGDETHPERNPLKQINENLVQMTGNCLSITNMVAKG